MPDDLALDPRFLPRGTRLGEYTVEAHIGEGGQGVLYRVSRGAGRVHAEDLHRRARALPEAERKEIDGRIRREAGTLMVIRHPNVVKLISCDWWPDIETGYPYFVMEHVEGDPVCAGRRRPARRCARSAASSCRWPTRSACCTSTKSSTAT